MSNYIKETRMKELDSFTIERLEDFIRQPLENGLTRSEQMELARIALAAKRAEPVAWTSQRSLETKNKIVAFTDDMSALDYGTANGWADIIELYTSPQSNPGTPQKDWPTEGMVIAGFESGAWDALSSAVLKHQGWPYSCRESAECVTGIFKAMLAVAPEKTL